MKKKYLVIGGLVESKYDNQKHFVSAQRLVDLFHVSPEECILISSFDDPEFNQFRRNKDLIWLTPRYSGNYILPKKPSIKCDMKDQLIKMGYRNEEWD